MRPRAPAKYRFQDSYDPTGDMANLDTNGLLPCETEYELGTPNLSRDENLLILASNTTVDKSSLALQLKWRPQTNSQVSLVTMISSLNLSFENDEDLYSFSQLETYTPIESQVFPNRLIQYGSNGSKLKLTIYSPYRRMRLVFRGQMTRRQRSKSPDESEQVFVKLNMVLNAASKIFDFKEEFSEKYAKTVAKQLQDNKSNSTFLHDRHEQLVRLVGECTIRSSDNNLEVKKYNLMHWGFYGRHFLSKSSEDFETANRVLALCDNGQAVHLGQFGTDSKDVAMKFGYGSLTTRPITMPLEKPYEFDWAKQVQDLRTTKQVRIGSICCGFKKDFELTCEKRFIYSNSNEKLALFDAKLSGKNGFAWIMCDDNCDLVGNELEAIKTSRETYLSDLEGGRLAEEPKFGLAQIIDEPKSCPLTVPLSSDQCRCSDLVGSKAASLAQLVAFSRLSSGERSFEVPEGFALTRYVYDKLVSAHKPLSDAIDQLERFVTRRADLDGDEEAEAKWLQELPLECARVRETMCNIDLEGACADLVEAVQTSVAQVFGDESASTMRVAVRSSSWGEDEADMSAAGQLDTKLNVECSREPILRAILECFASKFSLENIEYKRQHGLAINTPMAIVVQQMVQCQRAGVMFTCDPTSGDDRCVLITANYGLGESVVSGQSEPDSIYVRRLNDKDKDKFEVKEVIVGEKKIVIGNVDESKLDRNKCCLSSDESLCLAECAIQISKYFHSEPRDIEWGLGDSEDASRKIYLFQARPITGLEVYSERELIHECDRPSPAEVDFFTRANVGEVMPFATRPFTMTHLVVNWNLIAYRMVMKIVPHKIPFLPHISSEVQYYAHHAFFNVRFSSFVPLGEETQTKEKSAMSKAIEISLFGHEIDPQPEIVEAARNVIKEDNPFRSLRFLWSTARLRMAPKRIVLRERLKVKELRQQVQDLKLADGYEQNKLIGLYNQLNALFRSLPPIWRNHIEILMIGSGDNMILIALLAKYIKDSTKLFSTFSKLVSNNKSDETSDSVVISAQIPRKFQALAELIKQSGGSDELKRFLGFNTKQAIDYLKELKEFNEFMDKFGHRCYDEFEYEQKPWREDLKGVVEMMRRNCKSLLQQLENAEAAEATGEAGGSAANGSNRSAQDNIDEILAKSVESPLSLRDRLIIKHLLVPTCRAQVQLREHTKDILVDHADVMRLASRMLAKELVRQQRLPDPSLMYYLTVDEMKPLIRQSQPAIVVQALRRRQLFERKFIGKVLKFDEIIKGPHLIDKPLAGDRDGAEADTNIDTNDIECLVGTPASSGSIRGRISLVMDYKDLDKVRPGSILVTHSTDIAFSPIFPIISGIITEVGGLISHGAVVAREYGLPSVLGVRNVTRTLVDNELILLDADNGKIVRLSKGSAASDNDAEATGKALAPVANGTSAALASGQ